MSDQAPEPGSTKSRLLWFAGLWLAGLLTISAISYLIRLAIL